MGFKTQGKMRRLQASAKTESQEPDKRHLYLSSESYRCEAHYAWNYHLRTRFFFFDQEVRRGTMSLDGTDVGNGKVVTCVVGDMDRYLHGWAPPMEAPAGSGRTKTTSLGVCVLRRARRAGARARAPSPAARPTARSTRGWGGRRAARASGPRPVAR